MSWSIDQRRAFASLHGARSGIDTALLCALIDHESSWDQWAIRYEPAFFDKYVLPLMEKDIVRTQTEARARATSWGLMQIMGQTARELGFVGRFISELCDPDVGVDFGCLKLKRCMDAHVSNLDAALLAYNGGADPTYPQAIKNLIPQYR